MKFKEFFFIGFGILSTLAVYATFYAQPAQSHMVRKFPLGRCKTLRTPRTSYRWENNIGTTTFHIETNGEPGTVVMERSGSSGRRLGTDETVTIGEEDTVFFTLHPDYIYPFGRNFDPNICVQVKIWADDVH